VVGEDRHLPRLRRNQRTAQHRHRWVNYSMLTRLDGVDE
jgi:hypothetical protein